MTPRAGRRKTGSNARSRTTAGLLAAGLTIVSSPGASASSAAAPHVAEHADALGGFTDFTVISDDDIWAVGADYHGVHPKQTKSWHWDGTTWTEISTPSPGAQENELTAVSGTSSDDVWAAGYYWNGTGADRLLTEHWDGTAWAVVPNENPGGPGGHHHDDRWIGDLLAVASDDAWLVGFASRYGPVAEHWNGKAWQLTDIPAGVARTLDGLGGSAADDVWTVGQGIDGRPAVLHSDGSQWTSTVPIGVPDARTTLTGIDSSGVNDGWAVGDVTRTGDPDPYPLLEHFDGGRWQRIGSPLHRHAGRLLHVEAFAPNDVWLTGFRQHVVNLSHAGFVGRWDGTRWSVVRLPKDLRDSGYVMKALGPNDIWLITRHTQVLGHWDGTSWQLIG